MANATIGELARKHTDVALGALVRVAKKSESDAAVVSAANGILDRGYGRPAQSVEHSGPGGGAIKHDLTVFSDEQLTQLASILGGVAAIARRSSGGNPATGGETER